MTPRQLALLAAAFVGLLLLWGAAALLGGGPGEGGTGSVFPPIPADRVDTVTVARPRDTTVLVRRDSSEWTVNGHPADRGAVGELLDALADTARRGEPVAERRASHAGLGVDSAAGTRVRIAGRGGLREEIVAGQRSPDLEGGYLRRAEDSVVYLVRGRLTGLLGRSTDEWRDRRIAAVAAESVATIEVSRGGRSYRVARGGTGWTLAPGNRQADTAAVRGLLDGYRRVEASGFADSTQASAARFGRPDRRARLLRGDGSVLLTLELDSTAGGFWARADSGPTVYRLESWTADRLMPADSALRARPASR